MSSRADFRLDCRHFRGDRPCEPHKREGVLCPGCPHHDPIRTRALLIKLAAAGDVLRSTSVLPALHARYPGLELTWITAPAARPLLMGNALIDRVLSFGGACPIELLVEDFDLVVNLDAAADSCALASAARGRERRGFGLDERGRPIPLHPEAEPWYLMGLSDEHKRANTRTYPEIMLDILGLAGPPPPPSLHIDEGELAFGRAFLDRHGIDDGRPRVGLNTGAGGRWQFKKWTFEGYRELIRRLAGEGVAVILLGGPEEAQRNQRLLELSPDGVVDTGTGNSLREFASIVDTLDVMVSGDTLAMHIGMARGVRVVVLFGPTSQAEIDTFGRGEKIAAELDCLCCYRQRCDRQPNCMSAISVEQVHAAVRRQLAQG